MLLLKVVNLAVPPRPTILALANSFGGSLIIIGSVSNIIVVQQARQMGINIPFWDLRAWDSREWPLLAGLLIRVALRVERMDFVRRATGSALRNPARDAIGAT